MQRMVAKRRVSLMKKTLREELSKVWVKRNGLVNEKMVEHCLKSSKYVEVEDGYIDACRAKPTIHSDMYYDDETEAPSTAFEGFRAYNMQMEKNNFAPLTLQGRGYDEMYIYEKYNSRSFSHVLGFGYFEPHYAEKFDGYIRKATEDDLTLINQARADVKADYEKRLKTYFKRYADKISTVGYWANR